MRLSYTLPALADLASILDYIANRSPQGALRIQSRIQANLRCNIPGRVRRLKNRPFDV
jgi:plasmid stabilization system protein ParE